MNPLYKWPGGKGKEIKTIKEFYPRNYNRYVEPFFGGGAVYFELEHSNSVVNDMNEEVTNFLSIIKEGRGEEIFNLLKLMPNKEDYYYNIRSFVPTGKLANATRFYYMRKTCFRGMMRYNKSGGFNVPYGNYKTFNFNELLDERYIKLLKDTEILTGDFVKVFEKYNETSDFCFLDPPYHNTFSNYISDGFSDEKHIELADLFKSSKMKCLMVIGRTDFIEELYKDYIVAMYGKKYSITRATKEQKSSKEKSKRSEKA